LIPEPYTDESRCPRRQIDTPCSRFDFATIDGDSGKVLFWQPRRSWSHSRFFFL
jgi:hypothetical protein